MRDTTTEEIIIGSVEQIVNAIANGNSVEIFPSKEGVKIFIVKKHRMA